MKFQKVIYYKTQIETNLNELKIIMRLWEKA